ncbi:PREDICTED: major pollen allergen Lol p 11-like [Camelina sativa]|uniref:Major pollen allergen Lol p 11-like n=1 Tax=Camelina sativa TaxID=90675 RepID=A0ABM0TNF0_CAMSA|nr:PREDICTED: major pollen allergen Lol p 11-like [Camelina sativa]
MAKLVMLLVLCILPAIAVAARRGSIGKNTMVVEGRTYCDTCKFGFETPESSYFIPGATVKLVCKHRQTMEEVYTDVAVSDKKGNYKFVVHDDHKDEMCDVLLVKSSDKSCGKISVGREKSRVILNHYSGIASQIRHANNMGFEKDVSDIFCSALFQKYMVDEDEDDIKSHL